MSHPCLSPSLKFRRKVDNSKNGTNTSKKRPRIAFDVVESMDASDYLSQVIQEAKGMADIFVADDTSDQHEGGVAKQKVDDNPRDQDLTTIPSSRNIHASIEGSAASLSYLLSKRVAITPPPSTRYLPNDVKEWTDLVLSSFERLRGYLDRAKAKGFGGKQSDRRPLPTMKDRSSWHIFCLGVDEARGNSGAYFADDYDEGTNSNDVEEVPPWRVNLPAKGYEPSASLLLQMDQVMVRRVLAHLCFYVNLGWAITSGTGRLGEWIYALLARLEKPIHRDDAAVLFGLLKNLTLARSKIDPNEIDQERSNLAKLNVLIVVVGIYFEQGGSLKIIMTDK